MTTRKVEATETAQAAMERLGMLAPPPVEMNGHNASGVYAEPPQELPMEVSNAPVSGLSVVLPPQNTPQLRGPGRGGGAKRPAPANVAPATGPLQTPYRKSFAEAFNNADDVLVVFRVQGDSLGAAIPREFSRAYLEQVGNDPHSFVLKHIVPDYGGGDYLVRGRTKTGTWVGETRVAIEAAPRTPSHAVPATTGQQVPSPMDPRAWADAMSQIPQKGKTIGDAIAEVQALSTLEALHGGGKKRDEDLASLKADLAALKAAPPPVPVVMPAPQAQESELDRFLKLKALMKDDRPQHDPILEQMREQMRAQAEQMKEQLRTQNEMITKLNQELVVRREDDLRRQLEELRKEMGDRKKESETDSIDKLLEKVEKLKEVSDRLSPPVVGSGVLDVAAKALDQWSPDNIASMRERFDASAVKAKAAEAEIQLALKRVGGSLPKPPPLQKLLSRAERELLMAAKDDKAMGEAFGPVVMALHKDEKLRGALEKIVNAMQEENTKDLSERIHTLVGLIYGKGEQANKLADRVTQFLTRNSAEVLASLGIGQEKEEIPEKVETTPDAKTSIPDPLEQVEEKFEEAKA